MLKLKEKSLENRIWEHFTKESIEGIPKAKCNYCGKYLGGSSINGTSHLFKHHGGCKKVQNIDLLKEKQVVETDSFTNEEFRRHVAMMIIFHDYPLSMDRQYNHEPTDNEWDLAQENDNFKYPMLREIARDLLLILVSTNALESAFSTSDRIIGPHQSRLNVEMVEALMYAKSEPPNETLFMNTYIDLDLDCDKDFDDVEERIVE
ncbi:uncharacterized protein LOC124909649 [Impatiens glandulifera]|uniref:uncharacterized protein LOC124909649 n=1 Tax=Impatiens glandulifera TaxID=253017 RepID=UPI001FB19437|nr:uncharacterized protein LOC124909649 [Impatiens glandulifera]